MVCIKILSIVGKTKTKEWKQGSGLKEISIYRHAHRAQTFEFVCVECMEHIQEIVRVSKGSIH